MAKQKQHTPTWVLVIVILILLFLFVATLGQVQPPKRLEILRESRQKALNRHKKLEALLERQAELRDKLAKKFKRTYLWTRITLVILWLTTCGLLMRKDCINDIGQFLNFNQLLILALITFNFLTFGSLYSMNKFIESLKTRLENWVYGRYLDIDDRIEKTTALREEAGLEVAKIDKQISDSEKLEG